MQGAAEVVPVSSSAQLTLLPWLLDRPPAPDRTLFAAGLHAGSCLGIAVALRRDLAALDGRTAGLLALATLPAAVVGLVAADGVETQLGRPGPTAVLLAAAGLVLVWADRRPAQRPVPGAADAFAAALAQALALAPGVSRAGATLTALRLRGVERGSAYRFSMLMSLPVTAGAAGLTLLRGRPGQLLGPLVLGAATSAGTAAVLATRVMRRGSVPVVGSALYRLAVAAAVAGRLHRLRKGSS